MAATPFVRSLYKFLTYGKVLAVNSMSKDFLKILKKLAPLQNPKPVRKAGSMKGRFEVPDSFFEALYEDILDAFESKV